MNLLYTDKTLRETYINNYKDSRRESKGFFTLYIVLGYPTFTTPVMIQDMLGVIWELMATKTTISAAKNLPVWILVHIAVGKNNIGELTDERSLNLMCLQMPDVIKIDCWMTIATMQRYPGEGISHCGGCNASWLSVGMETVMQDTLTKLAGNWCLAKQW